MMRVEPVVMEGHTAIAIEVKLPQTTLLVVTTDKGYIMCGALDVGLLNERLKEPLKINEYLVGQAFARFIYLLRIT